MRVLKFHQITKRLILRLSLQAVLIFMVLVCFRELCFNGFTVNAKALTTLPRQKMSHGKVTRKVIVESKYPTHFSNRFKIENKNICKTEKRLSSVVIVHSNPSHFKSRDVMRRTFLDLTAYRPETIRVVFLFGTPNNSTIQQMLEEENGHFKDIVQGDFSDSYHNLTYKGVMGLKWLNDNCQNAEFVVKIDDDVFINFPKVFTELSFLRYKKNTLACNKIPPNFNPIQRGERDRWRVDNDEFKKFATYPFTSCSGAAVFMTSDLVPKLLHSALFSPFFWIDDVYLFGILPSKVKGVEYYSIRGKFNIYVEETADCFMKNGKLCNLLVGTFSREDVNSSFALWNIIQP